MVPLMTKIMISKLVILVLSFRISMDRLLYQLINARTQALQNIIFRPPSSIKYGALLRIESTE